MKFIYGKQDFNTLERGQENCYLLTNGLGGFSSCTMVNSVTRNDHACFMACTQAPNHRYNMVHRLSEIIMVGDKEYFLSTQQFADQSFENGYENQISFSYEDIPQWCYQAGGAEVLKSIAMEPNSNTVAVTYHIENRSKDSAVLTVTPCLQFVKKGEDITEKQAFTRMGNKIVSAELTLYFETNGTVTDIPPSYETYFYAYDDCDGRRSEGSACRNHEISLNVEKGQTACLELVYTMEPVKKEASVILKELKGFRKALEAQAGFHHPAARMLSKSANQFIAERESTGGKTILAGYPFFEDWGRDTMIAFPGCVLSARQYETARSILRTFMKNEKNGLMPNLFPEGFNEPAYNTVDAALLFINCVYLYYQQTDDFEFVKEAYPVMERIIKFYQQGTDYGIHMDKDGLIMAGQGFDQVTWMDVRVGEILPTPRHGKPVEINAYWYNALKIMGRFSAELAPGGEASYDTLAETVKASFVSQFWMEDRMFLKDVLSGTKADKQLRCNQIWAVSLPFTMLSGEQEAAVVQTVFEKLYTPYGLRTLEMEDEEFKGFYGGEQLARDLAYHQGTVWAFPLGAYYLSYLKVNGYKPVAVETVLRQLELMECAMREGCVGQLPEIYDGRNPSKSKGCFAQAWSVGELLRVYEAIEMHQTKRRV